MANARTGGRVSLLLPVLGGMALGCVDTSPAGPAPSWRASAVGEPTSDGFPSPAERLGLMAINRARSDPQTVKGAMSASYPARPPVIFSDPLAHSARFHAVNLELADVTLMHSSPCPLKTDVASSGCDGDPACACATPVPSACASCANVDAENSCGTAPFTRIGYFTAGTGVSATGEVAAAGYSNPMTTVDGWMDEPASSDGHRKILTDQGTTANTMGYGHATGKNCFSSFDVGDSGTVKNALIPKLPTAAVSPYAGAAGSFTFYATWADPALGAPASLNVVVDGACTAMTRELGTDTLNATYKATAMLAAGCHNYYLAAVDGGGNALTYPTTGALTVSVGNVACDAEYLAQAPAATCNAGGGGASGSGGATGHGGAGGGGAIAGGMSGGVSGATGGAPTGSGGAPGPATGGTTVAASGGARGSGGAPGSGGATSPTGSGGEPASGSGGAVATGSGGVPAVTGHGGASSGGCSYDAAAPAQQSLLAALLCLALLSSARRSASTRVSAPPGSPSRRQ